uniref:DinB family protein n=1 Tax=Nocardia donostiensis TaxID=1538463 RepID=UPI001FE32E98|nr:DinB family protein [Nocardia donostiensis]
MTHRRDLLRWQFDLTWSLSQLHFDALTDDDARWEPATSVWTVHPHPDGTWRPDWADTEPDPIPVPTIGWLTWHIDWWWSSALEHAHGNPLPDRTEVFWPGDAASAVARLSALRTAWLGVLDELGDAELDAPSAYPWPAEAGLTVAHLAAWVNAELMKNAAEIGQLRMLRAVAG